MKIMIFLLNIFFANNVYSYILNKTDGGLDVKWSARHPHLNFYFDSSNNNSLNVSTLEDIANESINEWGSVHNKTLQVSSVGNGSHGGRNDIYFASKGSFFEDEGVVGVTQIVYDLESGEIFEADIILNDKSFNLSSVKGSEHYVGDVLTHELGHVFGLGHSQAFGTSMFYRLRAGQWSIEDDDIAGLGVLYPKNIKGSISGKIIGSADLIGILGARVSAIKETTGEVAASSISDESGNFNIQGLSEDETYYLYIEPVKALSSLPKYYQERKVNFCQSGSSYRGSFYQGCNNRDAGHPYGVKVSSSNKNINLGSLSIKCSFSSPLDYMASKGGIEQELSIDNTIGNELEIGKAISGYFSPEDIQNNSPDKFKIDLSSKSFSGGDYYLEIKTISQKLFSNIKLGINATLSNNVSYLAPTNDNSIILDSENNPTIDLLLRIPISTTNSSLNVFSINVIPHDISAYLTTTSLLVNDLFPSSEDFLDKEAIYLLSIRVVEKILDQNNVASYKHVYQRSHENLEDNSRCPDAPETYGVLGGGYADRAANKSKLKKKSDSDLPIACGTIDFPHDQGPFGPIFSIVFMLMAFILGHRHINKIN